MDAERSDRRQTRADWLAMVAGSGVRVAIGLVFTGAIVVGLASDDAARMFQLLFLQGGLTALLSASAYARGAHLAASGADTGSVVRPFVKFVLLGAISAWVLGTLLVDGPGSHGPWVIAALALGSAGASLSGLLQGIIVVRRGGAAAFAPVVVVTTIAIVALGLVWGLKSPVALALLWVAPQVLGTVLLGGVLRRLDSTIGSPSVNPGTKDESQFARVGALNASSVAVAYQYRELWAAGQGDGAASGSFGVLRVTELAYQVAYMALASQPRRLNGLVTRGLRSRMARGLFVLVGLAATGLGSLPALTTDRWSLMGFVIAEAAVMPARLLTMVCYLSLLGRPTTRAYQGVMLATVLLSALSLASPAMTGSPFGLQLLQCVAAVVGVIGIAVVRVPHSPTYDRSL